MRSLKSRLLTPKQRRDQAREKRMRATFGFVPSAPPSWALLGPDLWPLPPKIPDDPKSPAWLAYRQIQAAKLLCPHPEYQFHEVRKWAFDFAWPTTLLALEIEGLGGRHQTIAGLGADCEKYSMAAIMGWRVVRATPAMVRSGVMLALLQLDFEMNHQAARESPGAIVGEVAS